MHRTFAAESTVERALSVKRWITDTLPLPLRSAGRYWYRRAVGTLDPAMGIVRPILRPGTTAVDAGAHNGVYSYFLSRAGLRVEAFEPVPECQAVIAAMPARTVTLHGVALSDHDSTAELVVPVQHGAPETQLAHLGDRSDEAVSRRISVRVAPLDSFALRNVSFLKIDVEGHELPVLRGAARTLEREHPMLYIEIEARHAGLERMAETFAWLAARGYSAFFVRPDGGVAPHEEFDVERHQQRFLAGDASAPYVNNFLFAHASDDAALRYLRAKTVRGTP